MMYFRLEHALREPKLLDNPGIQFHYNGPHRISVELRGTTPEEQKRGQPPTDTICVARGEWEPNTRIEKMFETLSNNVLPPGSAKPKGFQLEYIDEDGVIKDNCVAPLSLLPEQFKSFQSQVTKELSDYASRTVRVLRWRYGAIGDENMFAWLAFDWSVDGIEWLPMPSTMRMLAWTELGGFPVHPQVRIQVEAMVQQGVNEPLGHVLFGEAWRQKGANKRSAVILGISALEVRIKECISLIAPDVRWLAENAPTPPIVDMLEQYIPKLPLRATIHGQPPKVPSTILTRLRRWVKFRNSATHLGVAEITDEEVLEMLQAVRDVLWILDFCCGYEWALDRLSVETRKELGLE